MSGLHNDYSATREYLKVIMNNNFLKTNVPNLTPQEFDLLHGMIGKLKNKGDSLITISFNEVNVLIGQSNLRPNKTIEITRSMWSKVKMADFRLSLPKQEKEKYNKELDIILFDSLLIDPNEQIVKVSLSQSLLFLLNDFEKGYYTSLPYKHIAELKTTSSKKLLMLLTQYSSTGYCVIKVEDLMYILDTPPSYDVSSFNNKTLKKAMAAIDNNFKSLNVKKIYGARRKIVRYEFNFKLKPEKDLSNDPSYQEFIKREGSQTVKEVGPRATANKQSKSKSTKKASANKTDKSKLDPNAPSEVDGMTNAELELEMKKLYGLDG